MRRLLSALIVLPLAVSGCGWGRCTYESRGAQAEGTVAENGVEIARAMAGVGATRGSLNDRSFSWDLTSIPLDGHIVSVALTDASRPGVVRLDLPFLTQFQPATIRGVLDQRDNAPTPPLGGIFELVVSNRAVLEVRTDLLSRPVVRIPLTTTVHEDWYRPHCS